MQIIRKVIVLLLTGAILFAFSGCSSIENQPDASIIIEKIEQTKETETTNISEEESSSDSKEISLETKEKEEKNLSSIITEDVIADYMELFNMDAKVEDNKLILTYDVAQNSNTEIEIDADTWRETFEKSDILSEYSKTFVSFRDALAEELGIDDILVEVNYVKGNEILLTISYDKDFYVKEEKRTTLFEAEIKDISQVPLDGPVISLDAGNSYTGTFSIFHRNLIGNTVTSNVSGQVLEVKNDTNTINAGEKGKVLIEIQEETTVSVGDNFLIYEIYEENKILRFQGRITEIYSKGMEFSEDSNETTSQN